MRLAEMNEGAADDMMTMFHAVDERCQQYDGAIRGFMQQVLLEGAMLEKYNRSGTKGWRYANYHRLLEDLAVPRQQDYFVPDGDVFALAEESQCYLNCYKVVTEVEGYTYVEGKASSGLLIVDHAWLEDEDGTIIDPTWGNHLGPGLYEDGPVYWGVRFSTEFVIRRTSELGWCSIFRTEWDAPRPQDFPSLRHGFVLDENRRVTDFRRTSEDRVEADPEAV